MRQAYFEKKSLHQGRNLLCLVCDFFATASHFLLSQETKLVGVISTTTRCSFPNLSCHIFGMRLVSILSLYFSASIEKVSFRFALSESTTLASPRSMTPLSSVYFSPSSTTQHTSGRLSIFLIFFLYACALK